MLYQKVNFWGHYYYLRNDLEARSIIQLNLEEVKLEVSFAEIWMTK